MTLFRRYGRRLPIGAPPEIPSEQAIATLQAQQGFNPIPPELSAQVFSVFDSRPINGRDFIITESAGVPDDGVTFTNIDFAVPPGQVVVLRWVLLQFVPATVFAPGELTVTIRRNGAPIEGLNHIRFAPPFEWIGPFFALFGEGEQIGVHTSKTVIAPVNECWVTIAGNRLNSQRLPLPLEVGHGTPRVRLTEVDEREPTRGR